MVSPVPFPNTVVKHLRALHHLVGNDLVTAGYADLYSSIAQSVEHLTVNQGVTGSSPVRGATFLKLTLGNGD